MSLTPLLRFSDYKLDLESRCIDDIAKVTSGGTPNRSIKEYWSGTIPWITTSQINFEDIDHAEEFITKNGLRNSSAKLFPKGTILLALYGQGITRGRVSILNIDATTNQACAALILKPKAHNRFVFYFLQSKYNEIRNLSNDGGQRNLSGGLIKTISIALPQLPEQKKIADFLTSVDRKISQLTEKHRLLTQYKKGVMQQIFSQQLRFKDEDGSEFGAWEEFSLSQLGSFLGGGTPSTENDFFWRGDIPWISSSDIQEDKLFTINISRYINTSAIRNSATKVIPANSLLIVSRVGIGKFAVCNQEICTSQDFTNFTPNTSNVNFMAYLLSHNKNRLLSLGQGNTIKGFTVSDLSSLKLEIPCLAEQQKIALFLQAIDAKIDATNQQLEQAKLFKKGLLQQMFV